MNGFLVAAPHSGSGKTIVTLGLLRALRERGMRVRSAKIGPDYIDPAFHAAATGQACVNLDPWAMRGGLIGHLMHRQAVDSDIVVCEAMMGLFDGAADGTGSAGDFAARYDVPTVLVVDASRMSHSIAALVQGYVRFRSDVRVAGVILNRVGSTRHAEMLKAALAPSGVAVLGIVPSDAALALPSRHLGLVQAGEHGALDDFIGQAARIMGDACDIDALAALPLSTSACDVRPVVPLGQRIAVARDEAFAFSYPHLLAGWADQGAELHVFSPLNDEGPDPACDAVYLPGGYPELHAGRLSAASRFKAGMAEAQARDAVIFGECGGYMVLGDALTDADGTAHPMLGLLGLETSFAARKRHLGYRDIETCEKGFPLGTHLAAHEFHYSSVIREEGEPLFAVRDAMGADLGLAGLRRGRVFGSFMHVIDRRG